jgi:hypothetical protein
MILKDKVAVITGSGRGIGRGIAKLMAEEGAKVVVNDLGGAGDGTGSSRGPADEVVEEIRAAGGTAVANYDSVATVEGGQRIIQTALDNFGRLDIVVNNAGILRDRMIFNMTEEEWDAVIAVHLKGHFCVTKPASIIFRQQRSGRIINFSSTSGLIGNAGQANYGAAKAGIAGFTRVLALDLGKYGVTANVIAPNAATRMVASIPGVDMSRAPHPDDVAPMVVFLASDDAANVNGQTFYVSGGIISLFSNPGPVRTITKNGRWTVEEIARIFPSTLGMELINPAPAQVPRQG